MENERRIEILVIMAFVIFIILILFLIVLMIQGTSSSGKNSNKESSGIVYNYYNLTTINSYPNSVQGRVVYNRDVVYIREKNLDSNWEIDENENTNIWGNGEEELEYSSYSRHFREKDDFGSYVEEFRVYVKNTDSIGGYFEVIFNFEDCHGEEYSEAITEYLKPKETHIFKYKDIWYKERDICDWNYEVLS